MNAAPNGFRKAAIGVALALAVALPLLYPLVVVPLSPWQQAEVALAFIGLGFLASLRPALRPLIMLLSCFASMRYFYWRVTSTLLLDNPRDAFVSLLLLAAETYGLVILLLGYFQTVEVHPRAPAAIGAQPTVDVFIPTYNEPLDVLRRTVIGALAIDYPRKQVYVLDDGRRREVEELARRLQCRYLTRPDNRHAKAGNLNHALSLTDGELIAIFDADHVPVRGFLGQTVGFFEDARVALVQTAQHFFNPDPFERNLKLSGRIAPEQAFFYHVIQPGNDFWNAAFFCGSSAVLRRSAVQSIGGFRTETVTEDAHTALELHSRGWRSVYLPRALAAGLATETLAAHVQQRMRWARGMAQVLRLDCPLFKRGLTPSQRLNYFNATLHFFFGVPRLILVLAPLCYLLLGIHPIHADALALLAYILPHLALSTLANSMLSDRYRHSFWAGVYEVSIAPYTAWVTLLAVVNPRLGRFNVTDKGTQVDRSRLDVAHGGSVLALLALSLLALSVGFPLRLALFARGAWESSELHSILINSAWALANTWMLLAAACVAYEQPQQRRAPRLQRSFPCAVWIGEERLAARTLDVSESGVRVRLERAVALDGECRLELSGDPAGPLPLRARPRWCERIGGGMEAAFQFVGVDEAAHRRLVLLLFGQDESWRGQLYPRDDPFRSFAYLVSTPWRVTRPRRPRSLDGAAAPAPSRGRWREVLRV
jgi:cellulose synthase (UDP-forming)